MRPLRIILRCRSIEFSSAAYAGTYSDQAAVALFDGPFFPAWCRDALSGMAVILPLRERAAQHAFDRARVGAFGGPDVWFAAEEGAGYVRQSFESATGANGDWPAGCQPPCVFHPDIVAAESIIRTWQSGQSPRMAAGLQGASPPACSIRISSRPSRSYAPGNPGIATDGGNSALAGRLGLGWCPLWMPQPWHLPARPILCRSGRMQCSAYPTPNLPSTARSAFWPATFLPQGRACPALGCDPAGPAAFFPAEASRTAGLFFCRAAQPARLRRAQARRRRMRGPWGPRRRAGDGGQGCPRPCLTLPPAPPASA